MKACRHCEQENENDAQACEVCGHTEFGPVVFGPVELPPPVRPLGQVAMAREGRLVIMTCRTVEEATLLTRELHAEDILVLPPDEADQAREFASVGAVNLRLSARAFDASSKELRAAIGPEPVPDPAAEPLKPPMKVLATALGLLNLPSLYLLVLAILIYESRGLRRKTKTFLGWYALGFALSLLWFGALVAKDWWQRRALAP